MTTGSPLRGFGPFTATLAVAIVCADTMLVARPQTITAISGQVAAPPPPLTTGSSLIVGQVVDAAGGGIGGALVTLSGGLVQSGSFATAVSAGPMPGGPRRAFTTGDGRFVFADLPKGSYSIDVAKGGYVSGAFGRHRPDGIAQSLELGEGERNGNVRITMWKYGAISGILTDDAGEPFVGATIWSLRRSFTIGRSQWIDGPSATTDDRGFFRVQGLLPGEHLLSVVGAQSTLPAGVVDAFAESRLAGTSSEFLRQYSMASIGFSSSITSAGVRLGDAVLHPVGPYSQNMMPPAPEEDGRILAYQTTFYPSAVDITRAEIIPLASGEERTGADMRLRLVPTVVVSGTVVGPTGPAANIGVRLANEYAGELGAEQSFEAALTVTDAAGRFKFLGVPIGNYTLRALKVPPPPVFTPPPSVPAGAAPPTPPPPPPIPPQPTLWANMPLTVAADGVSNLTVKLNTGFRITGRFHFDGSIAKPPPNIVQTLTMTLQPVEGHAIGYSTVLRGRTDPDGSITTYEIPPGKYVIRMTAATPSWQALKGWSYKSSVIDGRDVGYLPLDLQGDVSGLVVTLTDRPTEITGVVRDEKGRADPTASVLIFSTERGEWSHFGETPRRIRLLRPSPTGVYTMAGLPPGDYFVAAIPEANAANWQDPRVMAAISRAATRISLGDGEKMSQDIVTRGVR